MTWGWLSGPGVPHGALGLGVRTVTVPAGDGQVRHLDFSDPPGDMTPQRYEFLVRQLARDCPDLDVFTTALLAGLGEELTGCHGCDPAAVEKGVAEFAQRAWDAEHP